ncbi:UNVERIFIED_CONTAM: hypothetical protein FKN15_047268 [Acipenser sinensis]
MGALMQKKAEVQVAYMGNFVEGDQKKSVSQGKAAVLNSPVISSYPRPEVTWFRDGYKIIPSGRMFPAFPGFMEEVRSSWDRPASAPSMLKQASPPAPLEGVEKLGLAGFPLVDSTIAALVKAPLVGGLARDPA